MKKNLLNFFQNSKYVVKKLDDTNITEIYNLEKTQPLFFKELNEKLTKKSIKEALSETPPNKELTDKYFLGFYQDNLLIAILDLVLKYPDSETVFVGLFMVNEKFCGQGVGSSIFREIEGVIKNLNFTKIRLGFVKTNKQSKYFWLNKCHFKTTGEISEHKNYTIIFSEKILQKGGENGKN